MQPSRALTLWCWRKKKSELWKLSGNKSLNSTFKVSWELLFPRKSRWWVYFHAAGMCCRRRRPPRCWSPGGPTPPSELAPQPLEHCPGVVRPKSLSLCWINPIYRFVLPLSFNRHLWVGDLPFLIFKAKTSETPSQTVCSLAAWLGESEKVLGDSGFGVCHYRLSLPPPHQGTARWIPLQSSPMDAALFQCNPAGAADWSPLVGNMLRSYKETFQKSWFPKGCLLTYLLTYLCFPTSTHTHRVNIYVKMNYWLFILQIGDISISQTLAP